MAEYKGRFPTRNGTPQGGSVERTMLDTVGGADGIRTKRMEHQDGSVTILRTRNGFPEFVTVSEDADKTEWLKHGIAVRCSWHQPIFYRKTSEGAWLVSGKPTQLDRERSATYWCGKVRDTYVTVVSSHVRVWAEFKHALPAEVSILWSDSCFGFIRFDRKRGYATCSGVYGSAGEVIFQGYLPDVDVAGGPDTSGVVETMLPSVVSFHGDLVLLRLKKSLFFGASKKEVHRCCIVPLDGGDPVAFTVVMDLPVFPQTFVQDYYTQEDGIRADPEEAYINMVTGSNGGATGFGYVLTVHGSHFVQIPSSSEYKLGDTTEWQSSANLFKDYTADVLQTAAGELAYCGVSHIFNWVRGEKKATGAERNSVSGFGGSAIYGVLYAEVGKKEFSMNRTALSRVEVTTGSEFEPLKLLDYLGITNSEGKDNSKTKLFRKVFVLYRANSGLDWDIIGNMPSNVGEEFAFAESLAQGAKLTQLSATLPDNDSVEVTYEYVPYNGVSSYTAISEYLLAYDRTLRFRAFIRVIVKTTLVWQADDSPYKGYWPPGQYITDHEVSVSFVWNWRDIDGEVTLINQTISKPAREMALVESDNTYYWTDNAAYIPGPLYTPVVPELTVAVDAYQCLDNLRKHQGVCEDFAGFSEEEEFDSSDSGLVMSSRVGSTETWQKKSGRGFIYSKILKLSELKGALWLFDSLRISDPIAPYPNDSTPPNESREYGFSDSLYNAIFNEQYAIHIRDGELVGWVRDIPDSEETQRPPDKAAYAECYRV